MPTKRTKRENRISAYATFFVQSYRFSRSLLAGRPPKAVAAAVIRQQDRGRLPSPADDYIEKSLDLNELLVIQPATFFGRAEGVSMINAGILPNDILVINRVIEPIPGKIVICVVNGELTVQCLERDGERWILKAENQTYLDIPIHEELEMV
ncbi:MAG: LexA family protein [Methylobacter sp.]